LICIGCQRYFITMNPYITNASVTLLPRRKDKTPAIIIPHTPTSPTVPQGSPSAEDIIILLTTPAIRARTIIPTRIMEQGMVSSTTTTSLINGVPNTTTMGRGTTHITTRMVRVEWKIYVHAARHSAVLAVSWRHACVDLHTLFPLSPSYLFPRLDSFKKACNRSRTGDLLLTRQVLYQLSYTGYPTIPPPSRIIAR
jgi:hypothetical protein